MFKIIKNRLITLLSVLLLFLTFFTLLPVQAQTGQPPLTSTTSTLSIQVQSFNCPDGSTYSPTLRVCEDAGNVYGIFTQDVVTRCGRTSACTNLLEFKINQHTYRLYRYSKTYYRQLAGTNPCPIGTIAYRINTAFCEESKTGELIGYFNPTVVRFCQSIDVFSLTVGSL